MINKDYQCSYFDYIGHSSVNSKKVYLSGHKHFLGNYFKITINNIFVIKTVWKQNIFKRKFNTYSQLIVRTLTTALVHNISSRSLTIVKKFCTPFLIPNLRKNT